MLAAAGKIPLPALEKVVFVGELTLDGRLRSVPGVLPMTMAAKTRGITCMVVPEPQADEAALVPGMAVIGARSLRQVVAHLCGDEVPTAPPVEPLASASLLSWRGDQRLGDLDMVDVLGMSDARFALEVAAAGGHHLMLSGPKGAGKTTLAERIPGLLPDLSVEESLELTAIYSLSGGLPPGQTMISRPPFRAPHHSASRTSLLGGGSGRVRPGEVSRAHTGALFLDEFPLFSSDIIEALRQPLESGEVTIARGEQSATFPARTMVVIACNPCPCGDYHPANRDNRCTCTRAAPSRVPQEAQRPDHRPGRHHPARRAGAAARGPRPAGPPGAHRADPGPRHRSPRAPGRALRRHRVAAQRGRARSATARGLAAHGRGRAEAGGAGLGQGTDRPGRHPGAPPRLDRRRPARRRPARCSTSSTSRSGCAAGTR